MQTTPRQFPEGLKPDIFKLPLLDEVSELRYDAKIQIISE